MSLVSPRRLLVTLVTLAGIALAAPAAAQAAPPAGVTAMSLDGRVELTWQPVAGATGYRVYRGTSATTVTTPLMASPLVPPDLNVPAVYSDVGATNGTAYFYAVRTIESGGVESASSRVVRATPRARSCSGGNVVVQENCFPGDSDWDVPAVSTTVEGFATAQSIQHGESLDLKVRAGTGAAVDVEIFRSGHYGGDGARLYSTILDVPVGAQPACVNDPNLGLLDCANWSAAQRITTTAAWPSGTYLARVRRRDNGDETHVLFVVRDDARRSDVVFPLPFTTYQAYNNWGGKSLYDDKSSGNITVAQTTRAVKVSFDRPYQQPHDAIQHDWYTRTDFATVRWLERWGYDVAYESVSDLERSGARVLDHRVLISGAHDEYYSTAMRTALEQARERGVDLLFTGANDVYWKVRFEPSPVSGGQDRVLVNYKTTQSGGPDPSGIHTGTWRDPAGANRPENALTGSLYMGQRPFDYYPLRVSAAEGQDRIWRYTGLDTQPTGGSTSIGSGLVGWEWDTRSTNGQEPAGVKTLSSSPASGDILQDAGRTYAPGTITTNATKYTWPSGSLVVDTGTNHWNWGLAVNSRGDGEPDSRIQQATTNVLLDMGAAPETAPPGIVLDDPAAPPLITQRSPATNATDVLPTANVRATFSRPMDGASITGASFVLRRPDGTAVPATVAYDDLTFVATLTPAAPLDLETTYTATLASTVRAANGVALGAPSTWSFTTKPPDRTAPSVSVTAPANGSTVIAATTVTATASDDTGVTGVQFKLDGADLGAEDTAAPYSFAWDAKNVSAGTHQLTAVARDAAGNTRTSTVVSVTVDPTGLVGAYGFEEVSGTGVVDASGRSNAGTIAGGAARNATGRFGRSITFDGVDDMVNVPDASSLDLTNAMTLEAWVYPTANGSGSWRTVALKEQTGGLAYGLYSNTDTNRPSAHTYTAFETDTRGTAQLPLNAWAHLGATYDGATLRLFLNGTQVSSRAVTGSMVNGTGALRLGGNSVWGEFFAGRLDEVRLYRRVLSASEIQSDMAAPITPGDTQAPTAPGTLTATGGMGQIQLGWGAATDNTGVDRYNVHRGTTAGFTPSAANRVAQVSGGTSYTDAGIPAGTYFYRVTAEDAMTNVGPASNEASATATADGTAPTVSVTAPAAGTTVTGNVNVTANAADNVGVAGVQFRLDGADLGTEDLSAPYSTSWNSRTVANGSHTLTAIARDAAGNRTTAQTVGVNVDNPPVDTSGLVGAWGFEESSGTTAADSSSQANAGTIAGATRTTSGRFGAGLDFDGVNDMVNVADAGSLDLTTGMTLEAWVRPTVLSSWRTVLLKEQAAGLTYGIYGNSGTNRPSAHAFVGSEQDARGTAALPLNTWSHVTATYNGSTLLLYVNGTQVGSRALQGSLAVTSGALRIGGNSFDSEFFGGTIDEVRVYNRALTAAEIQSDMNIAVVPAVVDAAPPTAPSGLTATGSIGQVQLGWSAAADNIGVTRYNVHRSTSAGFTPSTANRVAQVTSGTTYTDTGVAAGTYHYRVTAQDAAGNVGPASNEASGTATSDTTAPTVTLTAPGAGATVIGSTNLTATAADNVAVAGVQFRLDGADLGAEDTTAPYSFTWDTLSATNGPHTLAAIARDGAGNRTTASSVSVTVNNPPIDTTGLVGAWGFEEATGTVAEDASSAGNDGALAGGTEWTDSGRFGHALSFDGIDDRINIADASTLDLSDGMTLEAWIKPAQHAGWRTVLLKELGAGDLSYALYSSAWDDRPSGHVHTNAEQDTRGPAQLPLNQWTHLATTFDGSTLRLYVDGNQVASRALGGNLAASTTALRIGGNAVWGEYFKGLIDEVRVYRRALTAAQLQTDMAQPVRADAPPPAGPEKTGQFAAPVSWPLVPVHIASLSNGKVAVWDGFDAALNSERVWDPSTGTFDPIPSGRNLFCAAHVTLPDGRLFIAGGHIAANEGLKDTQIFNPANRTWFRGTDMARGRWYPTATTLPDGRILVVSGDNITVNAPGQPVPLKNAAETLPEVYDVDGNTWTPLPAGQRRMPLYPFMFVLPDGRVFDAGPDRTTRTMNAATGQWTTVGTSPVDGHSAVMYRPGKILKSGTWADVDYPGIVATNEAAAIDMTEASPSWRSVAPMHHGRAYHTLTLLADGKVLASGGGSESDGVDPANAVFPTEIWDPATGEWTETASHQRPRLYHSSALLLQDGRVLLAGGGAFGTAPNETNAEIYSPPYLFKGPRPTITSAPSVLRYGESFTVQTPDAARIQDVSLVRMGSVTHNFDMDQRFMHLGMQAGSGQLTVDGPSNANVAPPGYYYVIIKDDNGVPSVGSIVHIDSPSADTQAPTAPASLTTTVQEQDVTLSWGAATDDRGVTEYRVHRSTTSGFTPSSSNLVTTLGASARSYTDRNLSPNDYYYVVVAADAAGNRGPSSREERATVLSDSSPPTVTVSAPAAGATVSGNVSVTATAADNRGVTRVQFELDGANLGSADTSSPYAATWDTRAGSNGTHTLTAVAHDAAGNTTRSAPVAVTVDNGTPPTVSISAPAAGATVSGTAAITASAGDDRGVASVQFKVDGANLGSADTSAPYSANWDTRTVANGSHSLTAVATDTDGGTTTSAAVQVNVDNPITGLVAAYNFDEPSGTTVTDSSGGGLNGTVGGGAARSTAGKNAGAVSFDGVDDMVTIADANPLDLTTGMTLEAWVRPTTLTRWRTVLIKEQTSDIGYALYANTDANRPSTNVWVGGERDVLGTSQLAPNTWTHLSATYDGTTLRLFVNGVQAGTRALTGPLATSTRPLRIGGNAIWSEWFTGLIDDVRVYNRALTAAELQTDMNRPVGAGG